MEMIERFGQVLKRITAAIDLTKEGDPAAVVTTLRTELHELREELNDVRESAVQMREKTIDLEERLAQTTRFDAERERYTAKTLGSGAVVYVEKEAKDSDGKPQAYLCAQCFEQSKKSYMSPPSTKEFHFDVFTCSVCGYKAPVPNDQKPVARGGRAKNWKGFV